MALNRIADLPVGARFYRYVLQVNTYDYVVRHAKPTTFQDEASYNEALIAACRAHEIEIIGLADHFRIKSAGSLVAAATAAGIAVFPGFEAVTKEGVHFLFLFDPSASLDAGPGQDPQLRRA